MKKNVNITGLLVNGSFGWGLKAGLTKFDVEKILNQPLSAPDIETPDVDYYYFDMKTGVCLVMIFDKAGICYEMKIKLSDNEKLNFVVQIGNKIEKINGKTSIDKIVSILSGLNVEWKFDTKRMYMQTAIMLLKSGISLHYAFGEKKLRDYGLFAIQSNMEGHEFPQLIVACKPN